MLHVLLDTSIYHHDHQRRSAGFQTLTGLCQDRAIRLHVPSIVKREFISHFANDAESLLVQTIGSVKKLLRAGGPKEAKEVVAKALTDLRQLEGEYGKHVEDSFEAWLKQAHAVVHEVRPESVKEVFDNYFRGALPFKRVKNRDDFPDAFIWQIVNDIANREDKLFAIVADSNLRSAIAQIPKVEVFETLDVFIESQAVQNLFPDNFARNRADEIIRAFEWDSAFMKRALHNAASAEIVDSVKLRYRDDDGADIIDIGDVIDADFDFVRARYYGQNIFRVPFDAEIEATLDYFLLKSSYYGMPDEESDAIAIEKADWNESYMWVREDCTLELSGVVAIFIDIPRVISNSPHEGVDDYSVRVYSEITLDHIDSLKIKNEFPM